MLGLDGPQTVGTVMRSQKPKRAAIGLESGYEDDEQDTNTLRDLVEELIGEENAYKRTHRPDGTYEILNDVVVDRGPNPSRYSFFQ
jgi:NAD+ kinase